MRTAVPLVILVCALVMIGFAACQGEPQQQAPNLPTELLSLPRSAQMDCPDNPDLRVELFVWELPGVEPSDPNSAYRGSRGERLGSLSSCTIVTITAYAWSETDQEFWVHVSAEGIEGWITLDLIDFP